MDKLKEMWGRLPKWAKIGVPALLAVVLVYVYVKDKGSSTSGTLTEAATGSPDSAVSSGASTSPNPTDSSTQPNPDPTVTPLTPTQPTPDPNPALTPTPKPQGAPYAWTTLANHWADQATKNASAAGVAKPKNLVTVTTSMTKQQAMAAYEHNKTVAATIAAEKPATHVTTKAATVSSKTHTVVVSHAATKKNESPKVNTKNTHGIPANPIPGRVY